ncbi:MAG: prolipoprotein diacylglyceryl transferase family protein [Chloroflexota bacterium]
MYPAINIAGFALPTAGLLYIFGAYFTLSVIEKTAVWVNHDSEEIYALGTVTLVAGVVGARLVFVSEYWAAFSTNMVSIVWPLNTGYNSWAGLLIGLVAGFFYARGKQMPPAKTLDAIVPGLVFGLMIISLKDFLAGPGYGVISTVPWAISQFGISRHPVQIYELIAGVVSLGIWWRMSRSERRDGLLFLITTGVYSASRLYLDALRDNAWLTTNGLHVWQIISFIILVLCVFYLRYYLPAPTPKTNNQ